MKRTMRFIFFFIFEDTRKQGCPKKQDMNKFKVLLLSIGIICFACTSHAQMKKGIDYSGFFDTYYHPNLWEFSAGLGYPLYYGDLCGGIGCNDGNLSFVAGVAYKPWPKVAFEGDIYYTTLSAMDINTERNISFESKNLELALYGKYFLIDDIIRRHTDMFNKTRLVKPYLLIGISGLYYNPKAVLTDTLTGTTTPVNEGVTYPRFGLAIPAGFGLSFDVSRRFSILTEVIYRYTFTDLLDGVSEVYGNPEIKDSYLTIDLKLQWTPWAPRSKKKKQRVPKDVPQYNFSTDSSRAAAKAKSDSTKASVKNDEEMDYYEKLMKEAEEAEKAPESDEEYYDIIDSEPSEEGEDNTDEDEYYQEDVEEKKEEVEESSDDSWDSW